MSIVTWPNDQRTKYLKNEKNETQIALKKNMFAPLGI